MNISKLYQRAHALRVDDKTMHDTVVSPAEFYVGQALGEHIHDMRKANGEVLLPRTTHIKMVTMALRRLAYKPEALRRTLLEHLRWPEDMLALWTRLLRTYNYKPLLLLAIADGMEA